MARGRYGPHKSKAKKRGNKQCSISNVAKEVVLPSIVQNERALAAELIYSSVDDVSTAESIAETGESCDSSITTSTAEMSLDTKISKEVPENQSPKCGSTCSDYDDCLDDTSTSTSLCLEEGEGIPVVSVCAEGPRFALAPSLAAMLRRRGVADRAAVIVSVAGAYRGGKSFLLDYFLRYLYAKYVTLDEGSWLGEESRPLRGFSWRGGCERCTTGLLVWSQPIPVTLPSGEEAVVILMDTQGSFDDRSSVRDWSTIFALSTLLSSVQIYNLSQRIKEDDLQHLQLFTEYAKLADEEDKPFQSLQFLVRDWTAPYEYPYGLEGGRQYLEKKLQECEGQPEELKEVRRHIMTSFEDVSCFLAPHPGLTAAISKDFQGQLTDLEGDFKKALEELVPSILAPENLRVKMVNGQPLRARDLPVYLKAYLEEFNHNLPAPQSIMKAGREARWLAATATARAHLATCAGGRRAPAQPRAALRARLGTAVRGALRSARAACANDDRLLDLEQELNELLEHYIQMNEDKIALAIGNANAKFSKAVESLGGPQLCLHPEDLNAGVQAAAEAAREAYYGHLAPEIDHQDHERFLQELSKRTESLLGTLSIVNVRNNEAAVSSALEAHAIVLQPVRPPCMNSEDLNNFFSTALRSALETFQNKRNLHTEYASDEYKTKLIQETKTIELQLRSQNRINNTKASSDAFKLYKNRMPEITTGVFPCFHPQYFTNRHNEGYTQAVQSFYDKRSGDNSCKPDNFLTQLKYEMDRHYKNLCAINERNNEQAADKAFQSFEKKMNCIFKMSYEEFTRHFESSRRAAVVEFEKNRVPGPDRDEDTYKSNLILKINGTEEIHQAKNSRRLTAEMWITILLSLLSTGSIVATSAVVATGGAAVASATTTSLAAAPAALDIAALSGLSIKDIMSLLAYILTKTRL